MYEIKIKDTSTNNVLRALSISEEREEEMDKIVQDCFRKHDALTDMIKELAPQARNDNEFATFMMQISEMNTKFHMFAKSKVAQKFSDLLGSKDVDDN